MAKNVRRRNLVPVVFGMHMLGKPDDLQEAYVALNGGASLPSPLDRRGSRYVGYPVRHRVAAKATQQPTGDVQLVANGAPEQQIGLDGLHQHGVTPGQGWRISRRRLMSTFA